MPLIISTFILLSLLLLPSCKQDQPAKTSADSAPAPGSIDTVEQSLPPKSSSPTLFSKIPPSTSGLDFTHHLDLDHPLKRLYHGGFATGGIAIGDLDGDNLPDLFLASGPSENQLYRNLGNFRFEKIKAAAFEKNDSWSSGATFADIDNDGDLDLYLCNYQSPNQLFINEGNFQFTEQAASAGLDLSDASLMPSFCDYDNDGDLDCFVLTYRLYREGGWPQENRYEVVEGVPMIKAKYDDYYRIIQSGEHQGKPQMSVAYAGRYDRLFQNDGKGKFSDVSENSGIVARGHGLSATWWDSNDDGLMDLYVGNDFNDPDHFYLNQGNGTFKDVIRDTVPHTTWFSMGADFGDLNNDGLFDFLIADMSSRTHFDQKINMGAMGNSRWFLENAKPRQYMRNALYLNTGTSRFQEAAYLSGLSDTDWTWAVKLADFDNDGRTDAYFTNGTARHFTDSDRTIGNLRGRTQWDAFEDGPKRIEQNLAFRNNGNVNFSDVSSDWGLDHKGVSYSSAIGDLDGDGDLDLVTANLDEPISLYQNNASTPGTIIHLQGRDSNRFGFGAKVEITTASGIQVRQLAPASGFLSSNEPLLHFGTRGEDIKRLTVSWPGGDTQEFNDLEAGKVHVIKEGHTEISPSEEPQAIFQNPAQPHYGFVHKETPFDDYATQPLLANKLSQLGPGIAVSPTMIWFGGASGQAGEIWSAGKLLARFSEDAKSEDMGGLFFDADSDGDDDLYVVSGGVEAVVNHSSYRDRLYLNHGPGQPFQKAPLPDLRDSGGPIAAADIDRDGDLDLFIGGRLVPGAYPTTPNSRLLINQNGKFSDQSDQIAPGLRSSGLVTSAVWSDYDQDGWIDLLVTYEWGPVRIWKNKQGQLIDQSQTLGTENLLGWWNSITPGDLDNDGDLDYLVGNVGLNSKYETPSYIYYGEFDSSGKKQIIEAEVEDSIIYPVRGRSCTSAAIPMVGDKFKTYRDFASAPLQKIFSLDSLGKAQRLEANTLTTGWLRNDGGKRLTFIPLTDPSAQIASVFGTLIGDFNHDGDLDLFLAQNSFSPQPETGNMDGGLSTLLLGNGRGEFSAIRAEQSGIIIPHDSKSAARFSSHVLVGINNKAPHHLEPTSHQETLELQLQGPPGNPHGYGARVTLQFEKSAQLHQITAGSGYLSQSSPFPSVPAGKKLISIQTHWPNGKVSSITDIPPNGKIRMASPQ